MNRLFLLLILALCVPTLAEQAPEQWTPELSMKVVSIGAVVPFRDGPVTAWTEERAVMSEEKSEFVSQIFVREAGGRIFQLTRGEKGAESPAFSPHGRHVYFKSERDGKPSIYRIALQGGEAIQVTDWKGAFGEFRVSPDGKWIAFTARAPDEKQKTAEKAKLDFEVVDEDPPNHGLWVVSSEPGKGEPRELFASHYHIGDFRWSPDSRRIAFDHRPTPSFDVMFEADIAEVTVEEGRVRDLATTKASESDPRYSPDGRRLAYLKSVEGAGGLLDPIRIAVIDLDSGKDRMLAATFDEDPMLLEWTADSSGVVFEEGFRTKFVLGVAPLEGEPRTVYQPEAGTLGYRSRMAAGGKFAGISQSTPATPAEAWLVDIAGGTASQVSEANKGLTVPPLGETRVISWKAGDGLEIEGLLTLPVGYEEGQRVPLVLEIHGGPPGAYIESFIGDRDLYPIASFAAKGWAALRCNPRGSSSYGRKFRAANLKDWGGGDYRDLMAGVDHVIEMGVADPEKLAVMGWSYGGYMTSWVVTQTQRFKSAVMGAGLSNMISMWGTNDIPSVIDAYFGGPHWEAPELYFDRSAMKHVGNVTTPTLVLHGAEDSRVPPSQGFEFYQALKRRGIETMMVTYPRTPHSPREPKFVLDVMRRHVEWVEKHFD